MSWESNSSIMKALGSKDDSTSTKSSWGNSGSSGNNPGGWTFGTGSSGKDNSSSTKSWGSSTSSKPTGSSFGTGSSGFNNAWDTYCGSNGRSSTW